MKHACADLPLSPTPPQAPGPPRAPTAHMQSVTPYQMTPPLSCGLLKPATGSHLSSNLHTLCTPQQQPPSPAANPQQHLRSTHPPRGGEGSRPGRRPGDGPRLWSLIKSPRSPRRPAMPPPPLSRGGVPPRGGGGSRCPPRGGDGLRRGGERPRPPLGPCRDGMGAATPGRRVASGRF